MAKLLEVFTNITNIDSDTHLSLINRDSNSSLLMSVSDKHDILLYL